MARRIATVSVGFASRPDGSCFNSYPWNPSETPPAFSARSTMRRDWTAAAPMRSRIAVTPLTSHRQRWLLRLLLLQDTPRTRFPALLAHSSLRTDWTATASALTRPLLRLAIGGPWQGTASDLLYAVETLIGRSGARHGGWPRDIARFGGYVRRLAPNLRSIGVAVVFDREPRTRRRRITLSVSDAVLADAQGVAGASDNGTIQFGLFNPLS